MYKKGAIVVLAAKEDLPVFGEIMVIVVVDVNRYFFVISVLHTICFVPHVHAYEVDYTTDKLCIIQPDELVGYHPLGLYTCTVEYRE